MDWGAHGLGIRRQYGACCTIGYVDPDGTVAKERMLNSSDTDFTRSPIHLKVNLQVSLMLGKLSRPGCCKLVNVSSIHLPNLLVAAVCGIHYPVCQAQNALIHSINEHSINESEVEEIGVVAVRKLFWALDLDDDLQFCGACRQLECAIARTCANAV